MDEAAIAEGILHVLKVHVGHEGPLLLDARLVEDLHLDSMQLMTLVVETENFFSIIIEEGAEANIATVGDLIRYIRSQKERGAP